MSQRGYLQVERSKPSAPVTTSERRTVAGVIGVAALVLIGGPVAVGAGLLTLGAMLAIQVGLLAALYVAAVLIRHRRERR